MSFSELSKRLKFISTLEGEERLVVYSHINDKEFWSFVNSNIN